MITLIAGTKLGRYEIRSKIGEGGMGEVYLAQDTKLDRKVALKILPPNVAAHSDRMKRFVQEAKAASALNHPNIITIYEIDEADSINFIATEFIDGETLRERMLNTSPLKLSEILEVANQTASALLAAHAANIVHRDIKPENIILRRDGIVKVLDFGLAKLMDQAEIGAEDATRQLVKTNSGVVMGTAAYMSPEQARGLQVDARTDIWSLGVVLYEMLTGRPPFKGSTNSDLIVSVLEREPPPFDHEIPPELQRITAKMLHKDRERRYQGVRDLLLDLESLREVIEFEGKLKRSTAPAEIAATTRIESAKISNTEYILSGIRTHKLIVTVALLVLAVGGAALYYFTRGHISNTPPGNETITTIAVLPFVNASGNSDVEYLSDGMTESLITSLSQLPRLSVKARSSVFRYKGKDVPPQQVGKELNVQALLSGRVVQRGNDLTLHIELVDVKTETALWSGDYNRSMANIVSLPNEIARDVSSELRLKLSRLDEQKLGTNYTANPEAYQLYLKGRYYLAKYTVPEIQTSILYFQRAIDLDPSYALAYTGLADAYRTFGLFGEMPAAEFFPKAKAAAQKAIEIDDTLAEAHAELGFTIFWYDWDWNASENQLKRALELDPNSAFAHLFYAHLLSNTGRHTEGLAEVKRARELDPLDLRINGLEIQFLVHAGKPDEALASLRKTLAENPNNWFAHTYASSAYIEKGMFAEAVAEARRARELNTVNSQSTAQLGYALAKSGKQDEARGLLEELLKSSTQRYVSPGNIALIYNGLGERDETFSWLERGFEQRDSKMVFLKVEPKWNNLRDDPRFQDLLRRVGLPQ